MLGGRDPSGASTTAGGEATLDELVAAEVAKIVATRSEAAGTFKGTPPCIAYWRNMRSACRAMRVVLKEQPEQWHPYYISDPDFGAKEHLTACMDEIRDYRYEDTNTWFWRVIVNGRNGERAWKRRYDPFADPNLARHADGSFVEDERFQLVRLENPDIARPPPYMKGRNSI